MGATQVSEQTAVPAARMTLAEAVEALMISESWLEEAGGELTPEIESILDTAEGDLKEKVERVALKVRQLDGMAKAIGEEAERLYARSKARANAAKSLKAYLERCLEAAGLSRVDGLLVTVAMQTNPPSLTVPESCDLRALYEAGALGIELVPESFKVNKRDVLDRVKQDGEGILPSGWTVTRTTSLRIR